MTVRLIALLRGVNVGGKRVEMARLRALLSDLDYTDVRTYLQSGNAVFSAGGPRSTAADPAATAGRIEDAIEAKLGVRCRVIVRSAAELSAIMEADPLLHHLGNPSRHMVGFTAGPPSPEGVERLSTQDYGADQLRIVGDHLFLWCPDGLSKSPFWKLDLDRILGTAVTLRNWNTVTKLAEIGGRVTSGSAVTAAV